MSLVTRTHGYVFMYCVEQFSYNLITGNVQHYRLGGLLQSNVFLFHGPSRYVNCNSLTISIGVLSILLHERAFNGLSKRIISAVFTLIFYLFIQ